MTRATSRIPPTAATSARPSCGPASDDVAGTRGFDVVIDGTNADDLGEHRPGLRAADERGVRSPLAELGWTKAGRAGGRPRPRPADLGRARGAVSVQPDSLRSPRDAGASGAGGAGRGLPPGLWASPAISGSAITAPRRGIEIEPEQHERLRARLGDRRRLLCRAGLRVGRARSPRLPARRSARRSGRAGPLMRLFVALPIPEPALGVVARSARPSARHPTGRCAGFVPKASTSRSSSTARSRPSASR